MPSSRLQQECLKQGQNIQHPDSIHFVVVGGVICMDILENLWRGLERLDFDLGVTYRLTPSLVPIIEEVIYCRRKDYGSKIFFAKYVKHTKMSKQKG